MFLDRQKLIGLSFSNQEPVNLINNILAKRGELLAKRFFHILNLIQFWIDQ